MSRSDIFQDSSSPRGGRLPKNLRLNAREAAEYLTGQRFDELNEPDHAVTNQKYGRSSGTNN